MRVKCKKKTQPNHAQLLFLFIHTVYGYKRFRCHGSKYNSFRMPGQSVDIPQSLTQEPVVIPDTL